MRPRTPVFLFLALLLLAAWATACGGDGPEATPEAVTGPALVMFYTDN